MLNGLPGQIRSIGVNQNVLITLAKSVGARVTVLTVSEPFYSSAFDPKMVEQYKNHVAALATKHLDVAKYAAEAAGVVCDLVRVEHEQPYKAIIDTAKNRKCGAIVMASHGRRGLRYCPRERNREGAYAQHDPRHCSSCAKLGGVFLPRLSQLNTRHAVSEPSCGLRPARRASDHFNRALRRTSHSSRSVLVSVKAGVDVGGAEATKASRRLHRTLNS